MTSKASNPKDLIGSGKAPIGLVPQTAIALESLAFLEGALKYGAHNWRVQGVRTSIYIDACMRHLFKWQNGEECDPDTLVPHLASARACLGIILDAQAAGTLTDDRPPKNPGTIAAIDGGQAVVSHLKKLFADKNPRHYTIADTVFQRDTVPAAVKL